MSAGRISSGSLSGITCTLELGTASLDRMAGAATMPCRLAIAADAAHRGTPSPGARIGVRPASSASSRTPRTGSRFPTFTTGAPMCRAYRSRCAKAGTTNRVSCPGHVCAKARATTSRSPVRRQASKAAFSFRPPACSRRVRRAGEEGIGLAARTAIGAPPVHLTGGDEQEDRIGPPLSPRLREHVRDARGARRVHGPRVPGIARGLRSRGHRGTDGSRPRRTAGPPPCRHRLALSVSSSGSHRTESRSGVAQPELQVVRRPGGPERAEHLRGRRRSAASSSTAPLSRRHP